MNSNWTIKSALKWAHDELQAHNIPSPTKEASLILRHVLKESRHLAFLDPELHLSKLQSDHFNQLIVERSKHKPFAYLTGKVNFHNLDILVNRHTLIPRPETEELVDHVQEYLTSLPNPEKLSISDIGTGSGAIAITLALSNPELHLIASDISSDALSVARQNIVQHKLTSQIIIIQGSLLDPFPDSSLDIIIANLPYIPSSEMQDLSKDILDYEPLTALDGGEDGLDLIKKLLDQAKNKLRPRGAIFLEIWPDQQQQLTDFITHTHPGASISFYKDLSGTTRFAIITI